jgi:hypothetical protein
MRQIIYGVLPLGISICSMASVIWLLSFVGFELLLVAGGCFVTFASIVTLAEELIEWRCHINGEMDGLSTLRSALGAKDSTE